MDSNYYHLKSGLVISDEDLSNKMEIIVTNKPEVNSYDMGFEWNEMGMGLLFSILYKNEARYCPEHKSWYTYYEGAWRKDTDSILVNEKMKEFTRLMTIYVGEIENEETKEKYRKFINKLGDRKMRDKVLKDAAGDMVINANEFDNKPYLVNCLNGTYDLSTFTFRPHDYKDLLTMQTAFEHTVKKDVKCEIWENFINEVTEGNKAKARYIQKALGYSLLGMSNEECMFILHGKTTRNGKSTLLNTIEYMLGDYAKVAPVGMICKSGWNKDPESASPMLIGLKGKRFVTMSESDEYGKLDEEKIKQLTGGEEISARALYQAAITYKPQFTMWLSCNDLPMVTDKSIFASERIKVIEFNRHFKPEEQDKHLKDKLTTKDAMCGIFMWLIKGYSLYLKEGLVMNKEMQNVVTQYERDNDVILQFLENRCIKDENAITKSKDLYQDYKLWAKSDGAPIVSAKKFNSEMERHPEWFERKSTSSGYNTYVGIKLKGLMLC